VRSRVSIYAITYKRKAICALSPSSDNSYLAYPSTVPSPAAPSTSGSGSSTSAAQSQSGDVLIFSTATKTVANVIQAHKAPISFLAINAAGTMLATASDKGTVIRVWSLPNAEKLYQLRRGSREARIHSITFNVMSTLLAVSSAHDTVHIFKLGKQGAGKKSSPSSSVPDPTSPSGSVDGGSAIEGGYEAFMESKQKGGVGCVSFCTIPSEVGKLTELEAKC
jgi:autophagy-related protein 18